MNKLLAVIVVSTFAFGSVAGFAADAAKKEELTQTQRTELRNRADQLVKERANSPTPVKAQNQHAPTAKAVHAKKTKKVSRHGAKKARANS
jgi:hypothetical protein